MRDETRLDFLSCECRCVEFENPRIIGNLYRETTRKMISIHLVRYLELLGQNC